MGKGFWLEPLGEGGGGGGRPGPGAPRSARNDDTGLGARAFCECNPCVVLLSLGADILLRLCSTNGLVFPEITLPPANLYGYVLLDECKASCGEERFLLLANARRPRHRRHEHQRPQKGALQPKSPRMRAPLL